MNYYCLDYIDHKKGQRNQWKGKCDHQVKQNNGKENVFKHIYQGVYPSQGQATHDIHDGI